jgi:PIN domain nuclease of toxin-antitoxin system
VTPRRAPRRRAVREGVRRPAPRRRLLLDTHVWLWWQAGDKRLGRDTLRAIRQAAEVRLSAASAWEIAIKSAIGKLVLPLDADIEAELERDGFQPLAVEVAHAEALRGLPVLHRDPFDRMLVAQAMVEGLTLVTADPALARYGVAVLDATG